jgi:cell division septation protein DedD
VGSGQGLFKMEVATAKATGWGVQTGAFSAYGNVMIEVERLERQFGQPVLVNISETNGKTLYKIIVGAFPSRSDAEQLLTRLRAVGKNGFVRSLSDL